MLYLYIWLAFVAFMYLVVTIDYIYYNYNLPQQYQRFYDALTEEE